MQRLRSSLDSTMRPQGRIFYGWWMVAAGAGVQLIIGLLFNQAASVYNAVLRDEFGWSRTVISAAFSVSRFESGILGPLQGWMIDRYGPRTVMIGGLLLFSVGLMAFSQIQNLPMFYLTFLMMAVGSSLGGFLAITVALVSWFSTHRAKALAISQSGFAVGGLLIVVLVFAIEQLGWRTTAFLSGVVVLVTAVPMAMLIRHHPETYGETADGIPHTTRADAAPEERTRAHDQAVNPDGSEDFTVRQAMRTRAFWLISLGHASALLIVSAVQVHLVLHLNENLGYSLTQASLVLSLMTGMQMAGQVSGGFLGDRFDKRVIVVVCMASHAVGLLLLAYAQGYPMLIAFAVLHGWAWGTRGPLMQAIRADYFGATNFGQIMGWSSMIIMLGTTAGPIVAGVMADQTGNYEAGFAVLAFAAALGSAFFIFATRPAPPGAGTPTELATVRLG
jgi:MFS family permease